MIVLIGVLTIAVHAAQAEVYDFDALTDGVTDTTQNTTSNTSSVNSTTNSVTVNTNSTETSDLAVTLAECLIYEQLDIDDASCVKLMTSLNCPDYASMLGKCEEQYQLCLATSVSATNVVSYSECGAFYKSCTDFAVDRYVTCGEKFPPRLPNGDKSPIFRMSEPIGDVRIHYQDNPTPAEMESVGSTRSIQTGAAIFTGDNGSVTLRLPNGVTQRLGPNTYFRIADYYTTDTFNNTYTLLQNGSVSVAIPHQENTTVAYTVITPLWNVHAKGTEFTVSIGDDGAETVTVTSGEIEVRDHLGSDTQLVGSGETMAANAAGDSVNITEVYETPTEDTSVIDTEITSQPLDPWYSNTWGWVGVLVVLVVFAGLLVTPFVIKKVLARKKQ